MSSRGRRTDWARVSGQQSANCCISFYDLDKPCYFSVNFTWTVGQAESRLTTTPLARWMTGSQRLTTDREVKGSLANLTMRKAFAFMDWLFHVVILFGGIKRLLNEFFIFSKRLISSGTVVGFHSTCSDYGATTPPTRAPY